MKNIVSILALALLMISCGSSGEEGCTDSRAENYNPDATTDNGNCVFPNQKFLGNYSGAFVCGGALSVINTDNADFEITESSNPNEKLKVTITVNITGAGIFPFEATVSGNKLTFSELKLNNYTLTLPVVGAVTANLTFSGSAELLNDNINATIDILADAGAIKLTDKCSLIGKKKS